MNIIVKQLREQAEWAQGKLCNLLHAAANEIEQLEQENKKLNLEKII